MQERPERDEPEITEADLALPPDDPAIGEASSPAESGGPSVPPPAAQDAGVLPQAGGDGDGDGGGGSEAPVDPGAVELEDDGMPPVEVIREAMKAVIDPEIGYNVVDLGLLYEVDKDDDGHVNITMTLTTMGCPLTELIEQQVTMIVATLPGVEHVDVEFTFQPPWSPEMMSDDVRLELQAMGMNV